MQNLLDPAILFFVFGIFAGASKSNLEIPAQISRYLSLYLLMALGLKGGKVKAEIELQPLSAINQVLVRLARGDVPARVVLDFAAA